MIRRGHTGSFSMSMNSCFLSFMLATQELPTPASAALGSSPEGGQCPRRVIPARRDSTIARSAARLSTRVCADALWGPALLPPLPAAASVAAPRPKNGAQP
jgi:hypothetical protein